MSENPKADAQNSAEGDEPASEMEDLALLKEQMEEALREKDQFRTMAQRAQADLVNYRRRVEEERGEVRRNANAQLLLKVLSIADDLQLAMAHLPDDAVAPGWVDGLRLVQRNLEQVLDSEGVTQIQAEGQPFEPREHEAVSYEETPDGQEGMVLRVIRDGYKLHGRVLRPAQVAVSKAQEPQDQDETDQEEA